MTRKEPTQARSRETVRRVLQAADAEFAVHGFHTAQMTRIADSAEVSVGALYRFFPDKVALADALRDRYLESAVGGYADLLGAVDTSEDVLPTFVRVLHLAADLQLDHTGYYRLSRDRLPDQDVSWGASVRDRMVTDFSAVVRAVGLDASPDVESVFALAVEQVHAVLSTLSPDDGPLRRQRIAQIARMVGLYLADRFGLDAAQLDA